MKPTEDETVEAEPTKILRCEEDECWDYDKDDKGGRLLEERTLENEDGPLLEAHVPSLLDTVETRWTSPVGRAPMAGYIPQGRRWWAVDCTHRYGYLAQW
jgi:hypothetical protein